NQPSIFSVQVLGFGGTSIEDAAAGSQSHLESQSSRGASDYDHGNAVRVLSFGNLPKDAAGQLTARERRNMGL
ncbi:MAG: hypothetical protein ACTS5I_13255, partial [Rhodanobacter sp.]